MVELRDYQQAAVDSVRGYLRAWSGNPLAVLPTGAGKSHIIAALVKAELKNPARRVLMVTHVKELIEQNAEKLRQHWPKAPLGIYSASLRSRDTVYPIVFCGIQSVYKRAAEFGHVDVVYIDEAHLVPKGAEGMYRTFLDALRRQNPRLSVVGFTATPYRLKGGSLIEGDDALFSTIVHDVPIGLLIERGYLSSVTTQRANAEIDTRGVKLSGGEFVAKHLEQAAMRDGLVAQAVAEVVEAGRERRSWLLFCCGVDHAQQVLEELRSHQIEAALVTGDTPKGERESILARYRSGEIRALVNVNVLTTGFDAPETDLVGILRATQSPGLYVQIVGRGMRTADGKDDCLVLDFGGNIDRHGPIDAIRAPGTSSAGGDADRELPVKDCPKCGTQVWIRARVCPECRHIWEAEGEPNHESEASTGLILTAGRTLEKKRVKVGRVDYRRHKKQGKPDSLRVDYYPTALFGTRYSEWVCLEHEGFARDRAIEWWCDRSGDAQEHVPKTVDEALDITGHLPVPNEITVKEDGEFWRVVSWHYGEEPEPAQVDYSEVPF